MKRLTRQSLIQVTALTTWLMSGVVFATCLNNTVEFRNDADDGTYFHLQKLRSITEPAAQYLSLDGQTWQGETVVSVPGSQLEPSFRPAWSIEVHYNDDAIEKMGAFKESQKTGNRYAVLRGKHVPADVSFAYPATYRDQPNTHLSRQFTDRVAEWDDVSRMINRILEDADGETIPGYDKLTRSSPTAKVIGKLAKWIKNKRLTVMLDGGGVVDGATHPSDFIAEHPSYCQGAASTLAMMAAQLGVPARLGETHDHSWVEVFIDNQWHFVENQPETFLDVIDPPVPVYGYQKDGEDQRGYQPKSGAARSDALHREALMSGALIDIIADPAAHGFIDGYNRYSWFFDWSNPFVYNEQGELPGGGSALAVRPEVYSDSVYNYYTCNYGEAHNSSQCGGQGRQFGLGQWYNSQWELAALYPDRQDDLPYVFAKDEGLDRHVMYLTPIRDIYAHSQTLDWDKISAGERVRQQFYLSDLDGVKAVYAVLYLGSDDDLQHTIPTDGGDWYFSVNDSEPDYLRHLNGLSAGDGESDGLETNYLGLGQTVLRYELDLAKLNTTNASCEG